MAGIERATAKPATALPPRQPIGLPGKLAVVIGAGTAADGVGNGAAIAITYARAGARVIVADLDSDAADRTVQLIVDDGHRNDARAMTVDVTSSDSLQRLASDIWSAEGRVDVLHNNVGVTRMGSPPLLSEADWRLVMDTSLTGVFLACRAFLPGMIEAGHGSILNTSSIAAVKHTGYDYSAYYAAKAGLNHLTRTLAVQLAPSGVRVNAIMPGMIDTPLIYRQIATSYESVADMVAERHQSVPLGRMGTVWEVAEAALFLASDAASYITGICLAVDGGVSAQ